MAKLSKAPLIEAVFELRWGALSPDKRTLSFTPDEATMLPGQLGSELRSIGFSHHEPLSELTHPPFPHMARHRFRRAENQWPCYQIGLGVFTANQVNEGYDWKDFKAAIVSGLTCLDRVRPNLLQQLPLMGIELRYQDGLYFEDGENSFDFLKKKLQIDIGIPDAFRKLPGIEGPMRAHHLEFSAHTCAPKGEVVTSILQALINGRKGLVMTTTVRTGQPDIPSLEVQSIGDWLEKAHDIQHNAFETIIDPKYAETFA